MKRKKIKIMEKKRSRKRMNRRRKKRKIRPCAKMAWGAVAFCSRSSTG